MMPVLDQILSLTARVEDCLDEGDWAAAAELNTERQVLLTDLFANREPGDMDDSTREVLKDILARNEAAAARVRMEKELVATKQRRIHTSTAAVDAYRQAAVDAGSRG